MLVGMFRALWFNWNTRLDNSIKFLIAAMALVIKVLIREYSINLEFHPLSNFVEFVVLICRYESFSGKPNRQSRTRFFYCVRSQLAASDIKGLESKRIHKANWVVRNVPIQIGIAGIKTQGVLANPPSNDG